MECVVPAHRQEIARYFVLATVLNCLFQIAWFSAKCFNDINFDGIDYLGIARHITNGDFRASINAFCSPLISWLIAVVSPFAHSLLWVGKFVDIGAFLASVVLTYVLASHLWQSELAAAIAAFWFSLGRGFISESVFAVSADFLLTSLVLIYFLLLLRCLRFDRTRDWFYLGGLHGVAYLAKAIALPWLTVSTVAAAILFSGREWKRMSMRLVAAGLAPLIVAGAWGMVLQSKYGVFTIGSQFKTNILQWTLHERWGSTERHYLVLRDRSEFIDSYMVSDFMPPASSPWQYKLRFYRVVPGILGAERTNLPKAIREVGMTLSPGGIVAFLLIIIGLGRNKAQYSSEFSFALIVVISGLSLVLAYCMLVFDGRYIFPIVPLLIGVSVRSLVAEGQGSRLDAMPAARKLVQLLVVAGLIFSATYWASPFRTLSRDFQISCVDAGHQLRAQPGSKVIAIGTGPFPEHGVGWEAGYIAPFFANRQLVATLDNLPNSEHLEYVMADLKKTGPDEVMVWGSPANIDYTSLCRRLIEEGYSIGTNSVQDPELGEVGKVFFASNALH